MGFAKRAGLTSHMLNKKGKQQYECDFIHRI